jgi:hypothetical protein
MLILKIENPLMIIRSFFAALLSMNHSKLSDKNAHKLALSHPFFPSITPDISLPNGWDRKTTKSQITLSEDTRTVTFLR